MASVSGDLSSTRFDGSLRDLDTEHMNYPQMQLLGLRVSGNDLC